MIFIRGKKQNNNLSVKKSKELLSLLKLEKSDIFLHNNL